MAASLASTRSTALSAAAPLALVALAVALGSSGTRAFEGIVSIALCNLIIVIGLQVFIGNSGVYSFGQLGFATAGGYLAALLTIPAAFSAFQTPGLPSLLADASLGPALATLIAAAGAALLAFVVGFPLMRTSTVAIPISTFAFLIVAYNVVANWDAITGGSGGLVSIPRSTDVASAGLWAAAAIGVGIAFRRSASGYRLAATRESEVAARSLGVGVLRERISAFALSGALCGAGAALAAQQSGVLTPNSFYFAATVTTLTMLVVGGAGSVFGATLGTLAVTVVNEVLRVFEEGHSVLGLPAFGEVPGLAAIGLGMILLGTMILRPRGLTGGREAGEIWGRSRTDRGESPRIRGAELDRGAPPRLEGMLQVEGVSLSIGGLAILSDVHLGLERGEILGLIGPNGAGKTTLVNVISGFQKPDFGEVSLDGARCTGLVAHRLARAGLIRTFQGALPFPELSCLENVAVGAMAVGAGRGRAAEVAHSLLPRLGLAADAERAAGLLPAGSQRLLGVGRALAAGPRYLLLDEPAAGLNREEADELIAVLRGAVSDLGCGLLVIEHDMNVVMDLCPEIAVLDQGRVIARAGPREIMADPAVVASYLGDSFALALDA